MADQPAEANSLPVRQAFLAQFLNKARGELDFLVQRRGGHIDRFGVDEGSAVHAQTIITFHGRRYRYRRQVWPSPHPAGLQADLYATYLEERLLTAPITDSPTQDEVIL